MWNYMERIRRHGHVEGGVSLGAVIKVSKGLTPPSVRYWGLLPADQDESFQLLLTPCLCSVTVNSQPLKLEAQSVFPACLCHCVLSGNRDVANTDSFLFPLSMACPKLQLQCKGKRWSSHPWVRSGHTLISWVQATKLMVSEHWCSGSAPG